MAAFQDRGLMLNVGKAVIYLSREVYLDYAANPLALLSGNKTAPCVCLQARQEWPGGTVGACRVQIALTQSRLFVHLDKLEAHRVPSNVSK